MADEEFGLEEVAWYVQDIAGVVALGLAATSTSVTLGANFGLVINILGIASAVSVAYKMGVLGEEE